MNKEHEKGPRWTWKIAWLLLIVGILVFISSFLPKSLPSWGANWFAKTNADKCHFSPSQSQMVIALEPNEWSCEIVTPAGTTYRIDTDHNAKICFIDGKCFEVGPDIKAEWVGIKRGIFQLVSSERTTTTITIE